MQKLKVLFAIALINFIFTSLTFAQQGTMTWLQATASAGWSARDNHTSVVFDNKIWVIGGWDGVRKNDVWYSSDGVNWTQATASAGWSARDNHTSVVFDNKIWVMGGWDQVGAIKNDVWYSTDGVTWTQATANAGWSTRYQHTSVVFDNKIWVMGGGAPANYKNDVWYSSDGVSWTQATANAGWSVRYSHTSIVFDNKIWVMGGFDGSNRFSDVWYSTDGISWTQATDTAGWSARSDHASIVFDNKMWVIGGGFPFLRDVWYSTDGSIWTRATAGAGAEWSARYYHTSVIFDNKIWVLGGYASSSGLKNDVWYSRGVATLISPNGSEFLRGGSNQIIRWLTVATGFAQYRLLLSRNGGSAYTDTIAYNVSPNETTFNWLVPYLNLNQCRVMVQVLDDGGSVILQDASDGSFTIDSEQPSVFSLINPADGSWSTGRPIFSWTPATDSIGLSHYQIFIDGDLRRDSIFETICYLAWTQATANAGWSVRWGHTSVVYDNKMWVMGGEYQSGLFKSDVWYSSDGVNWTRATANAGWSARGYHTSIVFNNKIWVMGGEGAQWISRNDVWYSTDGVNWTQATMNAGWSGRSMHTSIVFDNKMWVIGGYHGSYESDVWYSIDGISWTQVNENARWSTRGLHTSVVFDDKMWALGGNHIGYLLQDVWKSSWAIVPPLTEGWRTWYVKAFDKAGNWRQSTEIFTVGIDTTPPNTFSLSYPYNNDTVYVQQPRLYWHQSNDALSGIRKYQLWINGILNQDSVPATDTSALPVSPLPNFSTNTWFVKAFDLADNIQTSNQVWSFIVRKDSSPPTVPILISPFNNSFIQETLPRFRWRSSFDDLSGVECYQLQYATNAGFTGAVSVNVTDTSYQVPSRLDDTTYYWRVQAVDRAGNQSDWSMVWSFEIDASIPNTPTLLSPINGVWFLNTSVIFNWSQVIFEDIIKPQVTQIAIDDNIGLESSKPISNPKGSPYFFNAPVRYILQVDTTANFSTAITDTTGFEYDTLVLNQGRYYWRVRAYDLAGNQGVFSNRDSFGVDITAPSIPNLVSPSNSAVLNDSFVRFIWNRSTDNVSGVRNYRFQVANDTNFTNPTDTVVSDTSITLLLRGTKYWHVKVIDWAGNASNWSERRQFTVTGIEEINNSTIPTLFNLYQNMPNPFSSQTAIRYSIPSECNVSLSIYDISGKLVKNLVDETMNKGVYAVSWNGNDNNGRKVGQGAYFYILKTAGENIQKKMLLLR